jgi:hypothetical protein
MRNSTIAEFLDAHVRNRRGVPLLVPLSDAHVRQYPNRQSTMRFLRRQAALDALPTVKTYYYHDACMTPDDRKKCKLLRESRDQAALLKKFEMQEQAVEKRAYENRRKAAKDMEGKRRKAAAEVTSFLIHNHLSQSCSQSHPRSFSYHRWRSNRRHIAEQFALPCSCNSRLNEQPN